MIDGIKIEDIKSTDLIYASSFQNDQVIYVSLQE